jgi:hypothetical protein
MPRSGLFVTECSAGGTVFSSDWLDERFNRRLPEA